jgi:hypothetical protein
MIALATRGPTKSGEIKVVVDDFVEPNGITVSPDEKKLYVIDTGFTDGPDSPSHIRVHWAGVTIAAHPPDETEPLRSDERGAETPPANLVWLISSRSR